MASQADIRAVENAMGALVVDDPFSGQSNMPGDAIATAGLSWWDRVTMAATPESYAESLVNEIYSSPSRTLAPDPVYDEEDFSAPNVYVRAKGAISDATSALTGFGTKAIFIAAGFVLVAVILYAAIPALIRR